MKTNRVLYALTALLMVSLLSSCGPSFIGVRTGPHFHHSPWVGGGWVGPGMWGPRPFWGPRPWGWNRFQRTPVIINRNFYGGPRYGYQNRSYNNPYNGSRGNGGGYRGGYRGGGYSGGSRGPR